MKSKQSYKNETRNELRILCEKIKYIGDLIEDLMDDTEGEIQKRYLQSEIENPNEFKAFFLIHNYVINRTPNHW